MADRLKIEVSTLPSRRGEVALVVLKGVLDAQTVEAFDEALETAARSAAMIVIEAHGLTGISSAGAGAFLVALRRAELAGGGVVLSRPSRVVRDVIHALGLQLLLPIGDTLEEAVGQLKVAT